jgi:hypothetical protein
MIRPILTLLLVGGLCSVAALADDREDQAKPKAPTLERLEQVNTQERLAEQFRDFKAALNRLAQRLARSSNREDQERAVRLKAAIEESNKANIDNKFDVLINLLKTNKVASLEELKEAMDQSKMLADDMQAILNLLLSENRDAQRKAEQERIKKLLEEINKIIRNEKVVRAVTEAGRTEKNSLLQSQKKVTQATQALARAMNKDSKSESNGKNKGESNGKNKSDNQGKQGQGNQGRQGPDSKDGKSNPGKNQNQNQNQLPPPQQTPGGKEVQDAVGNQKKSEEHIDKNKKDDASNEMDQAVQKLEEARKKLEEILRQLREEELRHILADLQRRCERMLAIQIEVYDGTVHVERAINQNEDRKASRAEEQHSLKLSDREQDIVRESAQCLQILEAAATDAQGGSAAAFPVAFEQVRDDAQHVTRRLGKADVGVVTQGIEQDIIAALKDMIEALKKAQKNRDGNSRPGQSNQPPNPTLIDLIAELKMIRAMQVRVNARTLIYARQYTGEQARDPDIQKELGDLARRQQKIFDATNDIARGKNR